MALARQDGRHGGTGNGREAVERIPVPPFFEEIRASGALNSHLATKVNVLNGGTTSSSLHHDTNPPFQTAAQVADATAAAAYEDVADAADLFGGNDLHPNQEPYGGRSEAHARAEAHAGTAGRITPSSQSHSSRSAPSSTPPPGSATPGAPGASAGETSASTRPRSAAPTSGGETEPTNPLPEAAAPPVAVNRGGRPNKTEALVRSMTAQANNLSDIARDSGAMVAKALEAATSAQIAFQREEREAMKEERQKDRDAFLSAIRMMVGLVNPEQ